jgi:hypothetical protein
MRPSAGLSRVVDNSRWEMPDCWFLTDGSSVLITNRSVDLPAWIELHPTETAGSLAFQTMKRLQSGWVPSEPIDAPNIWRIRAGDRVAFTGESRPGVAAHVDGLIEIFDFAENSMVVGETQSASQESVLLFGQPGPAGPLREQEMAARAAVDAIRRLGMPDSLSLEWHLER